MQEKIVGENYYLSQSAKSAYKSFIEAYNSHQIKSVFNVHALNLKVRFFFFFFFFFFAAPVFS
jgi:Domain of unknown function (DUF4217)